jgi:coenzyme F420-0:L-glutamate ligase/coenzyme F420-1:gamma-L-glutamate ligase
MTSRMPPLTIRGVGGLPEVADGDDLAALLWAALRDSGIDLGDGEVIVVSSKVLSKSLGLRTTGERADVVTTQTMRVVAERATGEHVTRIVESAAGPVMAAAGVDTSNVGAEDSLLLLPHDTDPLAADLRSRLLALAGQPAGAALGIVVSDTAGRPWRGGQTDFALGSAGVLPFEDHRGGVDADGRPLAVTIRCLTDELAAAADLVKGKVDQVPAALVSGCPPEWFAADAPGSRTVVRTGPGDWFALGHVEAVRQSLGIAPGSVAAQSVGVRPVAVDDLTARARRVALAAALGEGEEAEIGWTVDEGEDDEPGAVAFSIGGDPFAAGRLAARLEVALHAEEFAPGQVTIEVTSV